MNGLRLSEKERWTGVLRSNLGEGFEVLEDGLNGRRILDDLEDFSSSIRTNIPLDVVIIFLGINDICFEREVRIDSLIDGVGKMLEVMKTEHQDFDRLIPEVILIGTALINETQAQDGMYELEAEKVVCYVEALRKLADKEGCGFIDSGRIISTSEHDGVHIDAYEHLKLGLFIADYVRAFLTNANLNNNQH